MSDGLTSHRYCGLNDRGNPIAHDVGQQLEIGEHQHNDQAGGDDHRQIQGEVAQDHVIENQRKAGTEAALVRGRSSLERALLKGSSAVAVQTLAAFL